MIFIKFVSWSMRKAGKKGDWSDGGDVVKCGNKYNRKCGPTKKNDKRKKEKQTEYIPQQTNNWF